MTRTICGGFILLIISAHLASAQLIEYGTSEEKSVQWRTVKVPLPLLAMQANITGVIQVQVKFDKECKLVPASVHIVNRPEDANARKLPLLEDAALESVRQSEILCGDFRNSNTILTFEFAVRSPRECYKDESPQFTMHNNYIRIVFPRMCVETNRSAQP